jgi:hypothetical protein
MSTPREIAKIRKMMNLETNTLNTAYYDSDSIVNTANTGVQTPVGTISVSSADTLPLSNIPIGQQGFVTTTNKLYIYNGSGWYNIAAINNAPYWDSEANATYALSVDGTSTTVTIAAGDSDGTTLTYTATGDSNFDAIATVTKDSDNGRVFTITPIDSENSASPTGGSGILTFRASDGIDQASTASTFSITFGPDWSATPTESKIVSSDLAANDQFGYSVSMSSDGTYAIVGAMRATNNFLYDGAAYIFTRSGSTWTQQAKITASDKQADDQFGYTVSMSSDGSYAIVSATGEDTGGSNAGAAYIFTRSGSTWTQQQKIQSSDAQTNDQFGISVSISGDGVYAIVGARLEDTGGSDAGAAYVFTRSGSTWTQQQKLASSDLQANDYFGHSVSISSDGSYAIVSSFGESGGAGDPLTSAGAAYIFTRSGSTWTQQAKITASDAQAIDQFGTSVSINSDGTYVIVGADNEDGGAGDPISAAGAAYIFTRSGSTWTEQAILRASDAQVNDNFGGFSSSINSDGTYAIVSTTSEDGGDGDPIVTAGAAYLFKRTGSSWTQQAKLTASDAQQSDQFGQSASISGDGSYAIVGARLEDGGTGDPLSSAGAAYIYEAS